MTETANSIDLVSYRKPTNLWLDAWRRLRHNKLAIVGMTLIGLFLLVAIFANSLAPYEPFKQTLVERKAPPSASMAGHG